MKERGSTSVIDHCPPINPPSRANRFAFIDALRGMAAVMIVVHHCFFFYLFPEGYSSTRWMLGARGVQIFLIISGFVIAHSLHQVHVTWSTTWNFLFRRMIRLSPVYWVAMAASLLCCYWGVKVGRPDPGMWGLTHFSGVELLANAFYLQKILDLPVVSTVAWVLCIEVQFYIFYILLLGLISTIIKSDLARRNLWMGRAILGIGILSCVWFKEANTGYPWLFPFLSFFASGILIYGYMKRDHGLALPLFFPVIFGSLMLAKALFHNSIPWLNTFSVRPDSPLFFGVLAGLVVLYTTYSSKLGTWSGGAAIQYFGKISYSLYLIHMPALWGCFYLLENAMGFHPTSGLRILGFILAGLATATLAAQVVYTCIERPAMLLASRLRPKASK